ncbi:hypothetical protein KY338_00765 [Candidatus Woesearchaeota archaeon]|nr:hypothetical protein [Candidatus Woesearchaeota archaeon]MBW3006421.1 hypothetical protein [Candidatus Woesearchaeota archaeon]
MKKNYVGKTARTIGGLAAGAALLIGCGTQEIKKFTLDQYLSHSGNQIITTAADKKVNPAEIREIAETYCLLHNKLKDGIADKALRTAAEERLDQLGAIISSYVEKGEFEVYAYVDAKVDGVYRNRGGNVPMPARVKKAAFSEALLTGEGREKTRKQAEFLRRLQTAWMSVQDGEKKIDNERFHAFYLAVTQEEFASLIEGSTDHQYGGRIKNGQRESAWTAQDHKEYFGEDRSDDRKGQMTAFGLVSESELPVDAELEKIVTALKEEKDEKAEKDEKDKEDAESPAVKPGAIIVVDGKKVKVKKVNDDGSVETEPVKEEGAGEGEGPRDERG